MTPEDFVGLALAQPLQAGRAQYGYSMRIAAEGSRPPGIIALTWIEARHPAERDRIRAHSKQNVANFLEEDGFLSIVTGFLGLRGFTVTAWTDEAALRRGLGRHHAKAMQELFGEDFVGAVWTSVWTPGRLNRMWLRCDGCAHLVDVNDDPSACPACEAPLRDRPAFW